jgi:hypothetical protein
VAEFPVEFALPPAAVEPGVWHVDLSFACCTDGDQAVCVPVQQAWRVAVTVAESGADRLDLGAASAEDGA